MKTKLLLSTVLFCFASHFTFSQCIANAGNDTILCDIHPSFMLGGQPVATLGVPPYQYRWTCTYPNFTASHFLSDTTSPHPTLISFGFACDGSIEFQLEVTDSMGNTCNDTTSVKLSYWVSTLDEKIRFIHQGDSIQLHTSWFGGIPPLSYQWSPSTSLSNPNEEKPWAYPDTNTKYNLTIVDSIGCSRNDLFEVYIYPLGVEEKNVDHLQLAIYPNPLTSTATITLSGTESKFVTLTLFDATGKEELKTEVWDGFSLSRQSLPSGFHTYCVQDRNGQVTRGKFLVH